MKRRFHQLEFGICDASADSFFPIDAQQCAYFEALDQSTILCNAYHVSKHPAEILHQRLPACFDSLHVPTFCKFMQNIEMKDAIPDIDFVQWDSLLDFLHAAPEVRDRLKLFAKDAARFGPISILSAWQQFKVVCDSNIHFEKIRRVDANVDFFVAHDENPWIRSDRPISLYVPPSILNFLGNENAYLFGSKLVSKTRCHYDPYILRIANQERMLSIRNALADAGYLFVCKDQQIQAIAPPNSEFDNIVLRRGFFTRTFMNQFNECEHVHLTKILHYKVLAKHAWTKGVEVKVVSVDSVLKFIDAECLFSKKTQKDMQDKKWTPEDLEKQRHSYPRQHPELSQLANIGILESQGFQHVALVDVVNLLTKMSFTKK